MKSAAVRIVACAFAVVAAGVLGCIHGDNRPDQRFKATQGMDLPGDGPQALPHYCDILAGMRADRITARDRLIRAVFFYRFHRMRALEVFHSLNAQDQARCRLLLDLEAKHGRDADFLYLAFAEAIRVADTGSVDKTQVPEWIFEERERLFGDYFRSRADQGVLDPARFAEAAPTALVRELERTAFLQIAVRYDAAAWQRCLASGRSQQDHRAALVAASEALAKSAETLASLPGRAAEFVGEQGGYAKDQRRRAEQMESFADPKSAGIGLPAEYGSFDSRYHYREGRERISMAISEVNEGKGPRALRFLLEALEHLLFAREVAQAEVEERGAPNGNPSVGDTVNEETFEDYLMTVFANYARLTATER